MAHSTIDLVYYITSTLNHTKDLVMSTLSRVAVQTSPFIPSNLSVDIPSHVDFMPLAIQQGYGVRYGKTGEYARDRHLQDHQIQDGFRIR
jgi:hypothetical protein